MSDPSPEPIGRPAGSCVHVGAPKTGTSFVQDVLFLNRESLRRAGRSSTPPTGSTSTSSPRST